MTLDEALNILKVAKGCSKAELENAYNTARMETAREVAAAPTPALKERYQRKLRDLDSAFTAATPASVANLPKNASGSSAGPSIEPTADAPKPEAPKPAVPVAAATPPANPSKVNSSKGLAVASVGIAIVLAAFTIIYLSSGKGEDSGGSASGGLSTTPKVKPTAGPSALKTLAVTTERQQYKSGEDVVCMVDIPFDGYLRIYSIDVNGTRTQIFPNGFESNGAVRAGSKVRVPSNSEYSLKLELPEGSEGGNEKIVAVLSPTNFEGGAAPDPSNPFPSIEVSTDLKTRGLTPHAAGGAANGTGSYRVTP